jgi:hypothetical protein
MLSFSLDILPLKNLNPVEKQVDSRVEEIRRDFQKTGRLINPLIVTPAGGDKFLLLSGVNQFFALKREHIEDVVVQVIDDSTPLLRLDVWQYLLRNFRPEYLYYLAESMDLKSANQSHSFFYDKNRKRICCRFADGGRVCFYSDAEKLIERIRRFNDLIESCQRFSSNLRLIPDQLILQQGGGLRADEIILEPPQLTLPELKSLVAGGLVFPRNYFNITFENLIVGLNFPLTVLKSEAGRAEKTAFLKDLIRLRLQSDKSAVYGGRVYFLGDSPR